MSETDFDPRQAAQALNELVGGAVPHNALLGLEVVSAAPGTAVLRLPYREELIGNPETRVLHGGAVTALLDATCGMAVFLRLERFVRIATLDLRIDYLRPALPDAELRARGTATTSPPASPSSGPPPSRSPATGKSPPPWAPS